MENYLFYIREEQNYSAILKYIVEIWAENRLASVRFVNQPEAQFILDHSDENSLAFSTFFYQKLELKKYHHVLHFKEEQIILDEKGNADYLSSAFYLMNCVQEYDPLEKDLDQFGRYRYESSSQYRFRSIEKNLVQEYFDLFSEQLGLGKRAKQKSQVFLSHDIDSVYGSLSVDGRWAMKKMEFSKFFKIVYNEIFKKPRWLNFDEIMDLHDRYGFKSTFFFISEQGRGDYGIRNADYTLGQLNKEMEEITKRGFGTGMHKSTMSKSIESERNKFNPPTENNRYHYLRFRVDEDWEKLEEAGIKMDASLGFASHYGFRNNYGRPFKPFNLKRNRPYNFVEYPLHVMDGTFSTYLKLDLNETEERILKFIRANQEDAVLSILWHNMEFTEYSFGGWKDCYERVLECLVEEGVLSYAKESSY